MSSDLKLILPLALGAVLLGLVAMLIFGADDDFDAASYRFAGTMNELRAVGAAERTPDAGQAMAQLLSLDPADRRFKAMTAYAFGVALEARCGGFIDALTHIKAAILTAPGFIAALRASPSLADALNGVDTFAQFVDVVGLDLDRMLAGRGGCDGARAAGLRQGILLYFRAIPWQDVIGR